MLTGGVYLDYYGLTEPPFDITPNPRFLFYSAKHREAFNHLLYGIRERKGFVQMTGEVGAGKTTLCRAMLEQLDDHYSTALILNPIMSPDELVKAIALEFGLPVQWPGPAGYPGRHQPVPPPAGRARQGNRADHRRSAGPDRRVAGAGAAACRTWRRTTASCCRSFCMGQPELRDRLNNPRLRQLRQRITVRYHLPPLQPRGGQPVRAAPAPRSGGNGTPHFTRPALWRVYDYSKGIPRLVNAVCDKALLAGFVQQRERIDFRMVGQAVRELEGHINA